jgi:hypothetical protein
MERVAWLVDRFGYRIIEPTNFPLIAAAVQLAASWLTILSRKPYSIF